MHPHALLTKRRAFILMVMKSLPGKSGEAIRTAELSRCLFVIPAPGFHEDD